MKVIIFFLILSFAAFTRLYGNNWDQGQHLNPDERFLTMVSTGLTWPKNFAEYLDTSASPLNPHNKGFDFYVYGTWPIILVKFIAEKLNLGDYANLTLVGRAMSGFSDLVTLLFVFLIGKRLGGYKAGILSMLTYALMVLPIQLAHFYTTDPYLVTRLTISLYIILFPPSALTGILLGLTTGIALSAKISGFLIFIIIVFAGALYLFTYNKKHYDNKRLKINLYKKSIQLLIYYTLFIVFFYLSYRLLMPYIFSDSRLISLSLNEKILNNFNVLKGFEDPDAWFPPALQWRHPQRIIYPFLSIVFVGIGVQLSIIVLGAGVVAFRKLRTFALSSPGFLLILAWSMVVFLYQGMQPFLTIRYFYPIYPTIGIFVGFVLSSFLIKKITFTNSALMLLTTIVVGLWPISFLNIYSKNNTRVEASHWIYKNVPIGSTIAWEHWDDPLPLNLEPYSSGLYTGIELPVFNLEDQDKWSQIFTKLEQADYIVLSSNRAYGSITAAGDRYPQTSRYYQRLFNEQLGFKKINEFSSRPTLPIPGVRLCIPIPYFTYGFIDKKAVRSGSCQGISVVDDYTDETWTVYDHPKVTIFKKTENIPIQQLKSLIMRGAK